MHITPKIYALVYFSMGKGYQETDMVLTGQSTYQFELSVDHATSMFFSEEELIHFLYQHYSESKQNFTFHSQLFLEGCFPPRKQPMLSYYLGLFQVIDNELYSETFIDPYIYIPLIKRKIAKHGYYLKSVPFRQKNSLVRTPPRNGLVHYYRKVCRRPRYHRYLVEQAKRNEFNHEYNLSTQILETTNFDAMFDKYRRTNASWKAKKIKKQWVKHPEKESITNGIK